MSSEGRAPRAWVFDLDGTLVDSIPLVLNAFAHALAPFRPELGRDEIFLRLGGPPMSTFRELTGNETDAQEAFRRMESYGFSNLEQEKPFEGADALLREGVRRGVKLGLWTGRDRRTASMILENSGWMSLFDKVVCGDDLPTHKPDGEGLRKVLRDLAVGADEALFTGDADADVLGGSEVGVRTVLIRHRRAPDPGIVGKSWRVVETPGEAYVLFRG